MFFRWTTALDTCLAAYDPSCTTEAAFAMALGVSKSDAYSYLDVYGVDKWICGPGFSGNLLKMCF